MSEQIEGKNSVLEALRAGHPINRIYLLNDEAGRYPEITALAKARAIPVHLAQSVQLDRMSTTRNHQGVIATAAGWNYVTPEAILENATRKGEPPLVLILDGIEDPQNLGAAIRTAEAAGAHGLIIPERRAVGLTPVVSRASAGALEFLPVARVTNLTRTIEELKKAGLWFTGADMDGKTDFRKVDYKGAMGLVLGSEGSGISRLVKEHCDQTVRLPMWGRINSLNVSVAAGIMLYEIRRQREN